MSIFTFSDLRLRIRIEFHLLRTQSVIINSQGGNDITDITALCHRAKNINRENNFYVIMAVNQ